MLGREAAFDAALFGRLGSRLAIPLTSPAEARWARTEARKPAPLFTTLTEKASG
jgi:hypothetical protein